MGYFDDVYKKRLNRYGLNYQERVMTQRREVFDRMLLKSVYRIEFEYNSEVYPAIFERYKQDNTEIMKYLFTSYDVIIPNGTILMLNDPIGLIDKQTEMIDYPEKSGTKPSHGSGDLYESPRPWMVYYLEDAGAKGYNRYIMLKMTHFLTWKDRNKIDRSSYAYMYGQEDNMLKDEFQGRSRMDVRYTENLKMSFFVMPANEFLKKDDYFIINKEDNNKVFEEYYRVTGYDIQSQDGVEYVTVDPVYEFAKDFHDNVQHPVIPKEEGETEEEKKQREAAQKEIDEDYFWLAGQTKDVEAN